MKSFAKCFAALALCAAAFFGMAACSNGSDPQVLVIQGGSSGGGKKQSTPDQNGEEQNNTPGEYNLIIDEGIANGTVFAIVGGKNSASKARSGETVTIVIIADAGYELDSVSAVAANGYAPQLSDLNVYAKTFVMPMQVVRVRAAFKALPAGKYSVTPPTNVEGGSVTSNAASSAPGETVTLTATPDEGMRLDSWEVKDADGNTITVTDNTFVMPEGNVTIKPIFVEIEYSITVAPSANGSVTDAPATATFGTIVTLKIKPDFACKLESLTVTAEGGASVSLSGTGDSRTFTMPAKNVTVNAEFAEIPAASGAYTPIGKIKIDGDDYELVTFGLWPQTVKADDDTVTVDTSRSKAVGDFTYCKGSDGQWYAYIQEKGMRQQFEWESDFKYSDGSDVRQSSDNSYRWFKVEPIKWRVLTTNYKGTGNKLLLADNTMSACEYYDSYANRTIGGKTVYSNSWEHSKVRAFLNGLSYQKKEDSSSAQAACNDFLGKGFLQLAFTAEEMLKIADTSVDNSVSSTLPYNYDSLDDAEKQSAWRNGNNDYASATATSDRVFLLSMQEVTTSEYGFDAYNEYKGDGTHDESTRIRQATDCAKSSGARQNATIGMGGWWWLRSPDYYSSSAAYFVHTEGKAKEGHGLGVSSHYGVVPALCVQD